MKTKIILTLLLLLLLVGCKKDAYQSCLQDTAREMCESEDTKLLNFIAQGNSRFNAYTCLNEQEQIHQAFFTDNETDRCWNKAEKIW